MDDATVNSDGAAVTGSTALSVLIDGIKAAAETAYNAAKDGGASDGSAAAWSKFGDELTALVQGYTPDVIDPIVPNVTSALVGALDMIFAKIGGEVPEAFTALKNKMIG